MFGAILGDIIGSPYEFDRGDKTKDFPLFSEKSKFTDDTVMTIAVCDAFLNVQSDATDEEIRQRLVTSLCKWGKRYLRAGYGLRFRDWLASNKPEPYRSYGNGSAMRVSSVAWLFDSLAAVRKAARLSAEVTHNHLEGIKGAEATASSIYLARTGHSKAEIRDYIVENFHYTSAAPAMRSVPAIIMWRAVRRLSPRPLRRFWKGKALRTLSVLRCLSAATATR